MKTLFNSDHSAWLFCVSMAALIASVIPNISYLSYLAAVSVTLLYVAFDVLGYKHALHGPRKITQVEAIGFSAIELKSGDPGTVALAAYRLFQHGLFVVILVALWKSFGDYRVALSPFLVWITFGADVAYHWIAKAKLPGWDNTTYYRYGYWSGPCGWLYYIMNLFTKNKRAIPSLVLYIQAFMGVYIAVRIWL